MFKKNQILKNYFNNYIQQIADEEDLDQGQIAEGLQQGSMVILANPKHTGVKPTLIGQPGSIKVNANLGTSPFLNDIDLEISKTKAAEEAGAHTVMDLSTGGDLDSIRTKMMESTALPLGTVPIYGVAQKYIADQRDPAEMTSSELFEEIQKQAEQGVDFMTLHCGVTAKGAALARGENRKLGIVSRGGSIFARWMERNQKENPLLEDFDRLLRICLEYNVVISLGDGLRPGAGADAGDGAQWQEVIVLGELASMAKEYGVQVMIEGPGHVPLHLIQSQIQSVKRICHSAPLYVLGPLTTDIAPGYDHIVGAIGGALAGYFGASFLCYVTPAEHLRLPTIEDVKEGVVASKIAAHTADLAKGNKKAWDMDQKYAQMRHDFDWEGMFKNSIEMEKPYRYRKESTNFDTEECSMCGDFCALKMLEKELE